MKRKKGKEGPRERRKFRKNRKSNNKYPCNLKRQGNKYLKNSTNKKVNKILDFQREKAKKGLEKAAKTAKATRIFIAKRKKLQQISNQYQE